MAALPNDYSRCCNETCPLRFTCLRQTADITRELAWWSQFEPDRFGNCAHYINDNDGTDKG